MLWQQWGDGEGSESRTLNALLIIQATSIYLLDTMYEQGKKLMLLCSSS